MGTYTLQATKSAILRYNNQTANDHTSEAFDNIKQNDIFIFGGFGNFPQSAMTEQVITLAIYAYGLNKGKLSADFDVDYMSSEWDESTITYKTAPIFIGRGTEKEIGSSTVESTVIDSYSNSLDTSTAGTNGGFALWRHDSFWRYGTALKAISPSYPIVEKCEWYTSNSAAYKPYAQLKTTGAIPSVRYVTENSPGVYSDSSGGRPWLDKKTEITFKGKIVFTGASLSSRNVTLILRWKKYGESTWNEISQNKTVSDTREIYSFAVPANTFPSGVIVWKVTVTDEIGSAESSGEYEFSTAESVPLARCKHPKDSLLEKVDTIFAWYYTEAHGAIQYAFELQKSTDGTEWTTLVAKTISTETSTIVPAANLTGGDMYWRVRVYNNDDIASEWSDPAKVLVVAAPAAPGIVITSDAPRFSIRWSAADQQGYEVAVDGVTVLSRYGTVSTYTYDDWLTDGSHTVAVRVQNKYSLWSEWSTAALPILNTAGTAIVLGAKAAPVPQIRITSNGYDYYVVYRNGKKVAKVKPSILTTFTDNFANGENAYIVRGGYDEDGNYGESAEITVTAGYDTLTLYDTVSGKRLRLGNAKSQTRETNLTISRNATLTHYSGAQLPTAETGQQRDRRYQFECAFSTRDERKNAEALEAMLGHIVCVCDQYGTALVGIASSARVTVSQFMYSYTVSVDEVDFDEVTANAT